MTTGGGSVGGNGQRSEGSRPWVKERPGHERVQLSLDMWAGGTHLKPLRTWKKNSMMTTSKTTGEMNIRRKQEKLREPQGLRGKEEVRRGAAQTRSIAVEEQQRRRGGAAVEVAGEYQKEEEEEEPQGHGEGPGGEQHQKTC